MIVSELNIYDFRKFKSEDGNPGLTIKFHRGLNALIGENDSGKTAIIDALKLVLLTQSNEYIRPCDEDFYTDADGNSVTEFKIDCAISDFSENEAKNFIEYLSFSKADADAKFYLNLHYRAWKSDKNARRIFQELHVGDVEDGITMDGRARDLLKAVYLKPLRDAEREMHSGRGSRISQILLSHPAFQNKDDHRLIQIFKEANGQIEQYFTTDNEGKAILQNIRANLDAFNEQQSRHEANIVTSDIQLKAILETLSLNLSEVHPGLGELNLLFIAAELLLLKEDTEGGLKLALIEELEAHLHPQAQLRLINFLQNEYNQNGVQIIVSTHSPILASKINLKNIILMKDGRGYDLAEGETKLEKSDYLFLQRFLDATKANLFFAKGIIMVEGDAENILIPTIANIIGFPLEKNGVSVVNVGSTAFLRYSKIMVRKDGSDIGIPVSVITDCDIKPCFHGDKFIERNTEAEAKVKEKELKIQMGSVRGFISPRWTLEYCIAMSCLWKDFVRAIFYGMKILNAKDSISLTDSKIEEANANAKVKIEEWSEFSDGERAYHVYNDLMLDNKGKSSLKAIVAQCFASILQWDILDSQENIPQSKMFDLDLYQLQVDDVKRASLKTQIEQDKYLKYIVDAIKYASGAIK